MPAKVYTPNPETLVRRNAIDGIVFFLFRRRTLFLALTPPVLLLLARPTPRLFWIGVPFVIAGSMIRIWSAGYLKKLNTLITAGPFALCRNPLYIGSFLIALGYFIMCGRVTVGIVGAILFWLLHGGAIAYEEKLLRERYTEAFGDYCKRTPRLLPRLRWGGDSEITTQTDGKFSFKQVAANDEPRSAIGSAVFMIMFGLVSYLPNLAPAMWLFG